MKTGNAKCIQMLIAEVSVAVQAVTVLQLLFVILQLKAVSPNVFLILFLRNLLAVLVKESQNG